MKCHEVSRLLLLLVFATSVRDSIQKVCFGGQVWSTCGKTCTASCDDPISRLYCDDRCVPRCICPSETPILHHGTCIRPQACTAKYCRGVRFHPNHGMCCNGVKTGRPNDYPACCGTRAYSEATEGCVGGRVIKLRSRRRGCMGGAVWTNCGRTCTPTCDDPEPSCSSGCVKKCECPAHTPIFYQGRCNSIHYCPTKYCHGPKYIPKTDMCCSGVVSPRPKIYPQCCYKTAYSRMTHKCINKVIVPLGSGDTRPATQGYYTPICGGRLYKWSTQLCCGNVINPMAAVWPACCRKVSYCRITHRCKRGAVVPRKHSQSQLCGRKPYYRLSHMCCQNVLNPRPYMHARCCKDVAYSLATHRCSHGKIVSRKPRPSIVCGNKPYDCRTEICCKNVINRKPSKNPGCCNGVSYTKETHKCVNSNKISRL